MKGSKTNLYIDIDGVILTRGGVPAEHLDIFLEHILSSYNVFWLTSRCKGNSKYTLEYLSKFVSVETLTLLKKIKPTNFRLDKTEAIDFSKSFFWLDDEIFVSEKNALLLNRSYDSWIQVNLIQSPDQLYKLISGKLNLQK